MIGQFALAAMAALCFAVAIIEPRGREPDIPESICWTLAISCALFAAGEAIAMLRAHRH
ncbi:MAG TPA: hypothetical protein VJQ83_13710 [Tepidiformaceae bacterium]|nr:hypothetical protein [Tepidiformaceae bacterium]